MVNLPFNNLLSRRRKGTYCSGNGNELCIYPNGDIYPCGATPIKLGTLDDLSAVFRSEEYQQLADRRTGNIPECRGCEIEAYCAGGCTADALSRNGTLMSPESQCQFEREMFSFLVEESLLS